MVMADVWCCVLVLATGEVIGHRSSAQGVTFANTQNGPCAWHRDAITTSARGTRARQPHAKSRNENTLETETESMATAADLVTALFCSFLLYT